MFGIFEAEDIADVRKIIEDDVYSREKIWTSTDVYPWVQAF